MWGTRGTRESRNPVRRMNQPRPGCCDCATGGPKQTAGAPGDAALRELATKGRCIALRGLTKTFPTPDGVQTAVDGVDLDMFEGQIFGLLGHNGAGKTTTISMLTGLVPPSAGDAYVNGASITADMAAIRASMGVCPQHDVLWDDLTVAEHLGFFAGVKGMAAADVPAAVMTMIREVGLVEKVDAKASELSGGQKRKLSVGIALIAGSKVVVLDEPTSGMDPWSRRFTWNVIQGNKAGRTILLTTHFLEEADILCDRISIMAKGAVRCCGSSMYLKGLFGVGYNLTVVKAPGCDAASLEATIARHLPAPGAYRVLSNVGAEMAFQVPFACSPAVPALFRELEAAAVPDGAPPPEKDVLNGDASPDSAAKTSNAHRQTMAARKHLPYVAVRNTVDVVSMEKSTPPTGVPNTAVTPAATAAASACRRRVSKRPMAASKYGARHKLAASALERCTKGPSRPMVSPAASASTSDANLAAAVRGDK